MRDNEGLSRRLDMSQLPDNAPWYLKWMVENVGEAWRLFSVQINVVWAALATAYMADPAGVSKYVQDNVPASWWPKIAVVIAGINILARVTRQK